MTKRRACSGIGPDVFFADDPAEALAICRGCTISTECLWDNLDIPEGVVGGTTASTRKAIRERMGRTAPRRLPLDDLLTTAGVTIRELARRMDCDAATFTRDRNRWGGLTPNRADRAAVACGLVPENVWAEWSEVA